MPDAPDFQDRQADPPEPVRPEVPPPSSPPSSVTHFLGLLAGEVRLRMLRMLSESPSSVTELAQRCGISVALASHNLRRLRTAGIVNMRVKARRHIYALDPGMARSEGNRLLIRFLAADGWSITLMAPVGADPAPPIVQTTPAASNLTERSPRSALSGTTPPSRGSETREV